MANMSKDEAATVAARTKQFKGNPVKGNTGAAGSMTGKYSLQKEIPEGETVPKAPGDSHKQMDGNDKSGMQANMARAAARLNHETERGKHAPHVGGHHMKSHGGQKD